jgi:hypothetical protein
MIQVHVKFFLDESEDLRLKDIIEHAVDIDRTIFLKGVHESARPANRLKTSLALKVNVSVSSGVCIYGPSLAVTLSGARLVRRKSEGLAVVLQTLEDGNNASAYSTFGEEGITVRNSRLIVMNEQDTIVWKRFQFYSRRHANCEFPVIIILRHFEKTPNSISV